VVSLVGDEQAIEIDNLIRSHVSPDRYELHRVLCGNAAQFQGDERDIVFISLVDTAERGALSLRDQELFKQRFNVAASRARDQMWIVHSLSPHSDLKADDLRRQLIEHAEDPARLMRALEEKDKRTQSNFEREVMKRLATAGYRVTPHLVKDAKVPPPERVPLDPAALAIVRRGMWDVVNDPSGTAYGAHVKDADIAGKTGTVQVIAQAQRTKADALPFKYRDHAWFTSFAPVENPKIVVVVFAEHGGSGAHTAAPIAQALYAKYLKVDLHPAG